MGYPGEVMDMFDLDLLFQKSELIPVVIQDIDSRAVLMLGYANRESTGGWLWEGHDRFPK